MEKHLAAKYAMKSNMETLMQEVFDILDADDGKSFEEKKRAVVSHLREIADPPLSETLVDLAADDAEGARIKNIFWSSGEIVCAGGITLRQVENRDREGYLQLQRDYSVTKSMLKEEAYCDMLWSEHRGNKALMISIVRDGRCIGYCGIKNTALKPWEIAIELHRDWTGKGIGSIAVAAMLDAIKTRLGVSEFRVRIDPGNIASQKLFEKLGAVPNGISELWLHDSKQIEQCEEENLDCIDDQAIVLAGKFGVEPRKLLSHVLEYSLTTGSL